MDESRLVRICFVFRLRAGMVDGSDANATFPRTKITDKTSSSFCLKEHCPPPPSSTAKLLTCRLESEIFRQSSSKDGVLSPPGSIHSDDKFMGLTTNRSPHFHSRHRLHGTPPNSYASGDVQRCFVVGETVEIQA